MDWKNLTLGTILSMFMVGPCVAGCSSDAVVAFKDTLRVANEEGYVIDGDVEIDLNPNAYAKTSFGNDSRASLRGRIRRFGLKMTDPAPPSQVEVVTSDEILAPATQPAN